jgi:hypothetical protein
MTCFWFPIIQVLPDMEALGITPERLEEFLASTP